ncbi:outer membrane protein assembly factor BamC [Thiocapsa imhoffii]|uniref:outer membrane protein assembly factor BamC n=1 Tax=Thiocapsa imhoffii TaxID=382777 RepID=UPI001F5B61F9|nr:outer membrane protein assembly factor BamC [Thiocapsa imhoffii]
MRSPIWLLSVTLGFTLAPLLLVGCGSNLLSDAIPDQRLAYKQQREAGENLEIPPDLTASRFDDALDIPPIGGMTYSEYAGSRAQRQRVSTTQEVLPQTPNVELKRRDAERWLEVQADPAVVWPQVIAFWREQGILLTEQNPTVGVMRTDWLDNRAEIRRDFITRMVSRVAEGVYATSSRDQYSVRIEPGPTPGTTDIHLTHRGMEERVITNAIGDGSRTMWEPSGSEPAKEAEMLRRLMVFLGGSEARRDTVADTTPATRSLNSRIVTTDGQPALLLPEDPRRAWRTTGSALSRAGFAIEDRDNARGIYYVRYAGHDAATPSERPGRFARMAFWRTSEVDTLKQYQILIIGDDSESRVTVLGADGQPDRTETGQRILTLLQEQIR